MYTSIHIQVSWLWAGASFGAWNATMKKYFCSFFWKRHSMKCCFSSIAWKDWLMRVKEGQAVDDSNEFWDKYICGTTAWRHHTRTDSSLSYSIFSHIYSIWWYDSFYIDIKNHTEFSINQIKFRALSCYTQAVGGIIKECEVNGKYVRAWGKLNKQKVCLAPLPAQQRL